MEKQRTHAWLAFVTGILLVALPALSLHFTPPSAVRARVLTRPDPVLIPQTTQLLAQLKAVCLADTTLNDYFATNSAQPTEHLRDEILNALTNADEPALPEILCQIAEVAANTAAPTASAEYIEMLHLAALRLGEASAARHVADLMIYSDFPAVRIAAARLLRRIHGQAHLAFTTRDYFVRALRDPRFVSNDGCGTLPDKYYPVRTIAALALKEMGIDVPSGEEFFFSEKALSN
ncbi:MAG: hypothetical protein ACAI34_21800 [Verrucomicrobium sp.]